MIESWMVNIAIALVAGIGTWATMRARLDRVEKDLASHTSRDDTIHKEEGVKHDMYHKDFNDRINAGFKRLDKVDHRITILERDTATHLTMPKAEEKFVSKAELELHLKNIETTTRHTSQAVDKIEGKLEDLISLLSSPSRTIKE